MSASPSFEHMVDAGKQIARDREVDGARDFRIDDELDTIVRLDGNVARPGPPDDLVENARRVPPGFPETGPVAREPPTLDVEAVVEHRGKSEPRGVVEDEPRNVERHRV